MASRTERTIVSASFEVAHQRGAGAPLEHLVGRAAHVDVADVGPQLLDDQGGLAHGGGVRAVDLDGERALLLAEVHQLAGALVALDDGLRGDELHRHHAHAADPPHDQAEVAVRHPGHGSEPERGIDAEWADLHHKGDIVPEAGDKDLKDRKDPKDGSSSCP